MSITPVSVGICAIGMSQATYDSLLTTVDDPPQVVDVLVEPLGFLPAGLLIVNFHRHLEDGGPKSD